MKKALILFFVFAMLITPVASTQAQPSQIVPKCAPDGICGFCDITTLIQNIINFLIYLAVVVATLMFVYAGFKYLTAGGNPERLKSAHKIFWNVFFGLIFVLAAFLIVDTVMKAFVGGGNGKLGTWNKIECR